MAAPLSGKRLRFCPMGGSGDASSNFIYCQWWNLRQISCCDLWSLVTDFSINLSYYIYFPEMLFHSYLKVRPSHTPPWFESKLYCIYFLLSSCSLPNNTLSQAASRTCLDLFFVSVLRLFLSTPDLPNIFRRFAALLTFQETAEVDAWSSFIKLAHSECTHEDSSETRIAVSDADCLKRWHVDISGLFNVELVCFSRVLKIEKKKFVNNFLLKSVIESHLWLIY